MFYKPDMNLVYLYILSLIKSDEDLISALEEWSLYNVDKAFGYVEHYSLVALFSQL